MKVIKLIKIYSGCLLLPLSIFLTSCSDDNKNIVQGYIEGELIYVASSQAGELENLMVHRGQMVKANQELFVLENHPETDQLAEAQGQLGNAKFTLTDMQLGERPEEIAEINAQIEATNAAIEFYQAEMKRYKNLAKLDYAPDSDYDEALYQLQNSTANLEDLQAQLALAKQGQRENQIKAQAQTVKQNTASVSEAQWQLDQKNMSASAGGLIFDTYYRAGERVGSGKPVLSIQTPENIRVIFFVSETQLGAIQVGDHIEFQCDSCKNPTRAKISYISNYNEFNPPVIYSEEMREKLVYEIKAVINKKEALSYHPGQPVDVAINGSFS